MREFDAGQFDIAVIGAGHAGIEAALAAARLGLDTVCLTINLDAVGNMPCNPAIGGTAKGHLVRELDALGGEMARAADRACIQYRMLNRRKGPAVWSLRAQADRRAYQQIMKHTLERQEHLTLRQAEAVSVRTENGHVTGVALRTGAVYRVRAVVLCTGTYLRGRTIVGDCVEDSGPDGLHAAGPLTESLLALGLPLRRFKTGTPPRVNRRSIDFSKMQLQEGDPSPLPFSFETERPAGKPGRVLADIYHGADPPDHPGKPGQKPPVFRGHPGHRSPVLSVHRDKDRPFPGQGAAPAVHRAHGPGHRGNVHPGLFLLSAGGCAAGKCCGPSPDWSRRR